MQFSSAGGGGGASGGGGGDNVDDDAHASRPQYSTTHPAEVSSCEQYGLAMQCLPDGQSAVVMHGMHVATLPLENSAAVVEQLLHASGGAFH